MMQLRVALVNTARFGFMKKGGQINKGPEAINSAQNKKHRNALPTQILMLSISPSPAQVALHIFVFLYS